MAIQNLLDAWIAQSKQSKKTTDKQQQIVETAISLFAEKGYANTSTSEIAKRAGVAEGTIFRHFGTKDNLLLSVILPFIKESLPTMAEEVFAKIMANHPLHFEDFVRELLIDRLQFFKENREVFQVVVKEVMYNEELRNALAPIFLETVISKVGRMVEMFKERGELVDLPTPTIKRLLLTYFGGYFLTRVIFIPDDVIQNEEEEIEQVVQVITKGILNNKKEE